MRDHRCIHCNEVSPVHLRFCAAIECGDPDVDYFTDPPSHIVRPIHVREQDDALASRDATNAALSGALEAANGCAVRDREIIADLRAENERLLTELVAWRNGPDGAMAVKILVASNATIADLLGQVEALTAAQRFHGGTMADWYGLAKELQDLHGSAVQEIIELRDLVNVAMCDGLAECERIRSSVLDLFEAQAEKREADAVVFSTPTSSPEREDSWKRYLAARKRVDTSSASLLALIGGTASKGERQ